MRHAKHFLCPNFLALKLYFSFKGYQPWLNLQLVSNYFKACITTLACNEKGNLIISGGTDGKVCIWHWGRDEFLHKAGEIYITNLSIQSAKVTHLKQTIFIVKPFLY